jgi:PAS domain S-box-containing protein
MQQTITKKSNLTGIIAKLKLKELEIIDRLSTRHEDYVLRCIINPKTSTFSAVNGDWEKVTGYQEQACINRNWLDFIPKHETTEVLAKAKVIFGNAHEFTKLWCNILDVHGKILPVCWSAKYYPELNAIVSIGKVDKNSIGK